MLISRAGSNFCIIKCYRKRVFTVCLFWKTYLLCLFLAIWINCIFHWKAQFLLSHYSCDLYLSKICEKRDMSSAKMLQVDWMVSGKSLMYIENKRGPRTKEQGPRTLWHSSFYHFPRRGFAFKNDSLIALVKIISKKI